MIRPENEGGMKVAVLGVGAMGRTVIGHLKGCSLVKEIVGYDISQESIEETRRKCDIHCVEDLNDILNDEDVRLVFITAANGAHKELALAAMRAGKSIMCEKPIATTIEDATEMVDEAERLGVYFQIGFELRYSLLYTTVKAWIDQGKLGNVKNIQCNYISSEYWGPSTWRTKLTTAGSMFGEKLSHYVDLPRWWTGSEVSEVYAISSPNIVPYYDVRDNYHASCKFDNGAVSHLTFMMPFASTADTDPLIERIEAQNEDGHELRFLIMGEQGAAETNIFRRQIKRWEYKMIDGRFHSDLVETVTWTPDRDHQYFHSTEAQTHDIVRRIASGLGPFTPARDSLETMKVCEAADISVDSKRVVTIDELTAACA